METMGAAASVLDHQNQPPQKTGGERLNAEIQSELNLESVRTRAISLYKAISRIIEEVDGLARSNSCPKWHDVLGQFSMVNLELFNIVEEIKKVSKSFVVCPKNVNAEKATILPVMLSSKLLPELEIEDNSKREQLLHGMQDLPIPAQIDMLKSRIDAIAAACESAEKVLADTRKAYGLDTRQRLMTLPTLDKAQTAKIQEQENLLRAAVNHGEGLRLPADQRQIMSELPLHLADVLAVRDPVEPSGIYLKNTPPMSSVHAGNQETSLQTAGPQLTGRSFPSPSAGTSAASFDNTTSPLPHVNSPRSGTNMMNAPSPQQQMQQPQLMQQQLRQKMMQLPPHQQQLLTQQQLRQSAMQALGTLQGQYQIQFSQPLSTQQFQGRQLPTGHLQHGIGQNQLTQGNQLNRHMGQFSGQANSALFNTSQTVPNAPLIPNMSAAMASQSLLPRMQFALSGGNAQRAHSSQILNDQMFNLGTSNTGGLMPMQQQQQQQHGSQGAFGAMSQNPQNLQANMVAALQNAQHHPNFQQQRPQNQQ